MKIVRLDHLVLTVHEIDRTVDFYQRVLGMKPVTFGSGRKALTFGNQKINLHQVGHEFEPKAAYSTPGSGDLCFISEESMTAIIETLRREDVPIISGPVQRTGATGPMTSVYIRDPDGNLIEIAVYPRK